MKNIKPYINFWISELKYYSDLNNVLFLLYRCDAEVEGNGHLSAPRSNKPDASDEPAKYSKVPLKDHGQ